MYNEEIYNKLRETYGAERMPEFCVMVSDLFERMAQDDISNEMTFESIWWKEAIQRDLSSIYTNFADQT